MKAELKQKWLAALRSNQYTQGKNYLRQINDSFCCLGVLFDIQNYKWRENKSSPAYVLEEHAFLYELQQMGLSSEVVSQCITMNDIDNKNFCEIADYIEQNQVETA